MQAILATALSIGVMDAMWLTHRYNYHNALFQSVQKSKLEVRIVPAIMIYILLPYAVYIWAVQGKQSIMHAASNGALVGLIMYGFYDLTNYATFTNWTLEMALTDTLWGVIVCTIGAAIGFYFRTK